jgi:hypothetical protein
MMDLNSAILCKCLILFFLNSKEAAKDKDSYLATSTLSFLTYQSDKIGEGVVPILVVLGRAAVVLMRGLRVVIGSARTSSQRRHRRMTAQPCTQTNQQYRINFIKFSSLLNHSFMTTLTITIAITQHKPIHIDKSYRTNK